MQLKVKKLYPDVELPTYATPGAACFDLRALLPRMRAWCLNPGERHSFETGLAYEVPPGHVMLVFARSGLGVKHGIRPPHCVGVIDSDYRGPLLVPLVNEGDEPFVIEHGDRIAQAMIVPVPSIEIVQVDELSSTARGDGGFGSTGK
jgi:dUTP pyrophosphatase